MSSSANPSSYLTSLFGLEGKTALVTGASRGIGRGLAIALASAGATILLLSRNPSSAEIKATKKLIIDLGRSCTIFPCNLDSRDDVTSIIPTIYDNAHSIDILINCGGLQHRSPATDFPLSQWDSILNVNLSAGFILARELAKVWLADDLKDSPSAAAPSVPQKKIIFIASMTTFVGSTNIAAYTASKGAVGQLTKALSNEWAERGIAVNAIAPGYISTDLTADLQEDEEAERSIMARIPMGRWGVPDDLAGAVVYLCSRAAGYVSGEVHCVDGGFSGR